LHITTHNSAFVLEVPHEFFVLRAPEVKVISNITTFTLNLWSEALPNVRNHVVAIDVWFLVSCVALLISRNQHEPKPGIQARDLDSRIRSRHSNVFWMKYVLNFRNEGTNFFVGECAKAIQHTRYRFWFLSKRSIKIEIPGATFNLTYEELQ
jgi:hypothetical protein